MGDKDLSKPLAYSLRFRRLGDNELESRINTNTVFSSYDEASKYGLGGDYKKQSDGSIKWVKNPAKNPKVEPLYSAEYVQSLLGRIESMAQAHIALQKLCEVYRSAYEEVLLDRAKLPDLMMQHRIAVTPEYEGNWHAAVYGSDDGGDPIGSAEGDTPTAAVAAALTNAGISPDD